MIIIKNIGVIFVFLLTVVLGVPPSKSNTNINLDKALKLNETCCIIKGVPEECMGLCRGHRNRRSILNGLPVHRCDKHLHKIHSCVFEGIVRLHSNKVMSLNSVYSYKFFCVSFIFNFRRT